MRIAFICCPPSALQLAAMVARSDVVLVLKHFNRSLKYGEPRSEIRKDCSGKMSSPPSSKKAKHGNMMEQLSAVTIVVADTGEVQAIEKYHPTDATTNPSLVLKAAALPEYAHLIQDAIEYGKNTTKYDNRDYSDKLDIIMDKLAVNIGAEIVKIVPGYVSTEVDARLSFDTKKTVNRARRIIEMYEEMGISKSRILIKIASTYEGIRAGEILQKEGISCNLTLLFSLIQAAACAEAHITLISPFVGRILDWYKAKTGQAYTEETDPGVLSVKTIYNYYKKFNYDTIVMGASFRNIGEIRALAGCDRLTIAPALLEEMKNNHDVLEKQLDPTKSNYEGDKLLVDEASFRYALNEDQMATEKLSEGIRGFAADIIKLENIIKGMLKE